MSFYCIYMGEPGSQPIMQPIMNTSIINSKLASDFSSPTAPFVCNKILTPSTFFLSNDTKSNWNGLSSSSSAGSSSFNQTRLDTSRHFHIFVGDLGPDVEIHQLRESFSQFGQTSDCKIIRDQQTLKSKGYGFVSFVNKEDAEAAILAMNGQWLGSRAIRTNWASRKPPTQTQKEAMQKMLTYDEVFTQSSPTNCTVYCGGIITGLTEEILQATFGPYGCIQEIRVFKEKGYAFIRFSTKESASQAIVSVHGTEIFGYPVKCSWGKEPNESPGNSPSFSSLTLQSNYCGPTTAQTYYNQFGGYWSIPHNYTQLVQPNYLQTPTLAPVPVHPGYSYVNSGRTPDVPWPPTPPAIAGNPVQHYVNTLPTLLAYPAQPGFQQG